MVLPTGASAGQIPAIKNYPMLLSKPIVSLPSSSYCFNSWRVMASNQTKK
jgi:hypothetical protein